MNAYVLVGGRSARMGRSKSELFLREVAAAARGVFDDVIAVQRADGGPADGVATIFEDRHDEEAPIFGLACALAHAGGRCVVLAVDYPLVTPAFLAFLRDRTAVSAAAAVVPFWDGRPQHLCAGYDSRIAPLVDARIAARRYDLHSLLNEADAEVIAEGELRERFGGEPLMNVNTPAELERSRRFG